MTEFREEEQIKCGFCRTYVAYGQRNDFDFTWLCPDERWICKDCLKAKIKKVPIFF